ncbi:unknown [Prevotella sp. CAG:5226]|nr:unknown [Prevotella sp. CAG:5226]
MLRYADAIVKRGVDKLIDAIGHSPEPQTKNTETPQPQKRMGNDTDCAPQTTGSTTNCGITLMDEQCDITDIPWNHKLKTLKHPSRKNAWATTLTAV